MRVLKFLGILVVLAGIGIGGLLLFSNNKPPEDAQRANVTEAIRPPEAPAKPAPKVDSQEPAEPAVSTRTFAITPNDDSTIMWTGYKPIGSREGGFANFNGTVTVEGDDLETTRVNVTIDITSLFSDSRILTNYVKQEGFFNVEKFTEATFQSTSVKKNGDLYDVTGNFTLCGITKGLTFPARLEITDRGLLATAEFTINRFDWGMDASGYQDSIINKEVLINLEILADPVKG